MARPLISLASVVATMMGATLSQTQAPPPTTGWYIVQPPAEFAVLRLSAAEIEADTTGGVPAAQEATIMAGEAVLALEESRGTYLVFESFGRMSAIRGTRALVRAPAEGRPGMLTEDVQLLDRVLAAGSTLWITSINAGAGTATVMLDGGRTQTIPNKSIGVLMNAYADVLRQATFRRVQ